MTAEGKLIVIESIDEAAIEAQAQRLYRWLRGRGAGVELTGEPTYGPVGAQIRLFQQGRLQIDPFSLALFWTADRMDHLGREDGILSWLADGRHVLCARYLLFAYACQLDCVELSWLRQINARCRRPDLTLFLDVDPVASATPDAERLRQNYWTAMDTLRREGESADWASPIVVVDGGLGQSTGVSADKVFETCRRQVVDLLEI